MVGRPLLASMTRLCINVEKSRMPVNDNGTPCMARAYDPLVAPAVISDHGESFAPDTLFTRMLDFALQGTAVSGVTRKGVLRHPGVDPVGLLRPAKSAPQT